MTAKEHAPHIDPKAVKISLLSVAPGKEVSVAHRLSLAIEQQTGRPPACLLKLFGRYDLCAIYESDDYTSGPSSRGGIDDIRGGNQVLAFPWHHGGARQAFSLQHTDDHVWGLLFFRINESLARDFGARIEVVLTDPKMMLDNDGVSINVLGTTGWAELVFVVRGRTFLAVTKALAQISQREVLIGDGKREHKDLFSAKTFSLLGIDVSLIDAPPYRKLREVFGEKFSSSEGSHPHVTVTCVPGSMARVGRYGLQVFGAGFSTFGSTDCVFTPKGGTTWGDFIAQVLEMRRSLARHIYSTSVHVSSDLFFRHGAGASTGHSPARISRKGLKLTMGRMKLFTKWGPVFENRLKNLSLGISNLLQDPLIGDCFVDLRRTVDDRLPALLEKMDPVDKDNQQSIGEYIEVVGYGAEERANGAFLALENAERRFSPTKGGIQRVLRAAGAVARSILSRAGLRWNGFVVSGFQSLGFSSHSEAINLPLDKLFAPHEWWGMFHEVGHVGYMDDALVNMDGGAIDEILRRYSQSPDSSLEYLLLKNFLWEVGADTFDLYFCYGPNFDFYLKNILGYITVDSTLRDVEHIQRCFFAYEYWKNCLIGSEPCPPRQIDLDAELGRFGRVVRSAGYHLDDTRLDGDSLERAYACSAEALRSYHAAYGKCGGPFDLGAHLKSHEIVESVESVMSGAIWCQELSDPSTFILALKMKRDIPFPARIAAILTLWHTAVMQEDRERTGAPARRRR